MKEKFNVSISLKGSDRLDKSVDAFCDHTSRDRACALRYLLEVGLSACHHGFDLGLLKIKPINSEKSRL